MSSSGPSRHETRATVGSTPVRHRPIQVDVLARVEGEGSLTLRLRGQEVTEVRLGIFEPPRFFEGFLRGRSQLEIPDITARICGICPVAYQMSGSQAIEAALGITVTEEIRILRRLLYLGEWIESHALHVFLLHAPDFLGYPDALSMARDHPDLVRKSLRLKKIGNTLMAVIGGREIHPVNVRVGGFYRAPARSALKALLEELTWARATALDAVAFAGTLTYPDLERDYEFVSLRHERDYPVTEGRIVSSGGLDIPVEDFEDHFCEEHVRHSNALHSVHRGHGPYLVGPLARFNLNEDRLRPVALEAARTIGLEAPCRNPFRSLPVRAVELVHAVDEAIEIIEGYVPPEPPTVEVPEAEGRGSGCTEAPRGMLYHRYAVGADGLVREARIVPPTAQNLRTIEDDLRALGPRLAELPHAEATWLAEQAIRNYDPCISCATHFLRLRLEWEEE